MYIHVPSTGFDPHGTVGQGLINGVTQVFGRFFKHGFRFTGPSSIVFPPPTIINATAEILLMVTNNSLETLRIGSVDVLSPFSYFIQDSLPVTVNAGASVPLSVRFGPTAIGMREENMTLRESSGEILLTVNLSGEGIQSQPPPVISGFTPTIVAFGDPVTISGQYFIRTTSVRIGNTAVNFVVVSDTQISIDADATTGRITVVTLFGSVTTTNTLRVIFRPPNDP
jgi:hypothetical protein